MYYSQLQRHHERDGGNGANDGQRTNRDYILTHHSWKEKLKWKRFLTYNTEEKKTTMTTTTKMVMMMMARVSGVESQKWRFAFDTIYVAGLAQCVYLHGHQIVVRKF